MGTTRRAEYRPSNSCQRWDGRCRTAARCAAASPRSGRPTSRVDYCVAVPFENVPKRPASFWVPCSPARPLRGSMSRPCFIVASELDTRPILE
jgi:hypothetical protein